MRLVDLSYPVENGMTTARVDWHPRVEIVQIGRVQIEGSESHKVLLGSHSGTHMDAPAHMVVSPRKTIDMYDLSYFWGNGKLLNIPKSNFEKITKEDIIATGVRINPGDHVVVNTGWYKKYGTLEFLTENPYFSEEAAKYLVELGIKTLCMDMPTPENPDMSHDRIRNMIHHIMFEHGIAVVEYMNNLDEIKADSFELITVPLRLKNVEASPIRAIAKINN